MNVSRTHVALILFLAPLLLGLSARAVAQPALSNPPGCDRACLLQAMDNFVASMTTAKSTSIPLSDDAEIRENTKIVRLNETSWARVRGVRSIMTFADALTGNVMSRAGVELGDGKPAYLSTRLKVTAGARITDVEISADTSSRVVSGYVWNLDPVYTAVVPAEQRSSRVELEALARRYMHSLSTHQAVQADFDPGCNRFHSGQQITNVARNSVEGGQARTCASSLEGTPPWGPTTELRIPVVDPERGVVFAVTLLHYLRNPQPAQMYVSEVFKVVGGRIVHIDNIGLMMQGTSTLGFVH